MMVQSQPRLLKLWWWYLQSRVRLFRSVVPPLAEGIRWWRSHHSGVVWQPGKEQPPSRAISAAVWPGVAIRRLRPSCSGTLVLLRAAQ